MGASGAIITIGIFMCMCFNFQSSKRHYYLVFLYAVNESSDMNIINRIFWAMTLIIRGNKLRAS